MNINVKKDKGRAVFAADHPEYQRRLKAFEQAWHHNRLEGLEVDAFGRDLAMKYVRGEITDEQYRQTVIVTTSEDRKKFNETHG